MTIDTEREVAAFLSWLGTAKPRGGPLPLFEDYRLHLLESISESDANETVAVVFGSMQGGESPIWPALFDRIYAADEAEFNLEPSRLLVEAVSGVTPGTALDVAMGQGRNAIFLAGKGWEVTGVDVSPIGIAAALHSAAAAGVHIATECVSLKEYDFGEGVWDLIVLTYTPMLLHDNVTAGRIENALRPGGHVVIESFGMEDGRPRRPVDLDPELLVETFSRLDVVRLDDVIEVPDWHPSPQRIIRFVARAS
jgi:2-polyprenyl-3-methyl-5-hydroxy-6-metoxy-1,4-benzoquinol methylase